MRTAPQFNRSGETAISTILKPGTIIHDPRIAYEDGGFACPLEQGKPAEFWAVMRVKGHHVQLVPVSPKAIDDEKRDGVMMMTHKVITNLSQFSYLCLGFTVTRYLQEIVVPADRPYTGNGHVMPVSFDRALKAMPFGWNPPDDHKLPDVNWHALYLVKSMLWNEVDKDWPNLRVGAILDYLPDYDPFLPSSVKSQEDAERVSVEIVESIREYLTAKGRDTLAITLI